MTSFFKQPPSIPCAQSALMRVLGSAGHGDRMSRWILQVSSSTRRSPYFLLITALTYILRPLFPKPVCTRAVAQTLCAWLVTDGWLIPMQSVHGVRSPGYHRHMVATCEGARHLARPASVINVRPFSLPLCLSPLPFIGSFPLHSTLTVE